MRPMILGALCALTLSCQGLPEGVTPCTATDRAYEADNGRVPYAGQERFYRLGADEFCETTDQVILEVEPGPKIEAPIALISPHAGWQFSGVVTSTALSRMDVPDLIILVGNNHKGKGARYSVWADPAPWQFPFGDVPIDTEVANLLVQEVEGFEADTVAHLEEHSNEMQVVWLQRYNPNVRIVPIMIDDQPTAEELQRVGRELGQALQSVEEPFLIIASTDLTHYQPEATVKAQDAEMVDHMVALDGAGLFELVHPQRGQYSMCGLDPVVVAIEAAKTLGATTAEEVMYRTSFEVFQSDDGPVGYTAVVMR